MAPSIFSPCNTTYPIINSSVLSPLVVTAANVLKSRPRRMRMRIAKTPMVTTTATIATARTMIVSMMIGVLDQVCDLCLVLMCVEPTFGFLFVVHTNFTSHCGY
jgi:hypothetical protein